MPDDIEKRDVKVLNLPSFVLDRIKAEAFRNGASTTDSGICRFAIMQYHGSLPNKWEGIPDGNGRDRN